MTPNRMMANSNPPIMQWNCRGIYSNYEELQHLLANFQPACICLQELILGQRDPPKPSGYRVYTSPRQNMGRGGAAILAKNSLPAIEVDIQSELQAVAIRISLPKKYTICSIYLPPNTEVDKRELTDLIMQLPRPFLLLGDCNSRNVEWGDSTTNPKGRTLSSLIEDGSIALLNEEKPTYYCQSTNTWSFIDMSLCSTDILFDFTWDVLEEDYGSDHFPILLSPTSQRGVEQRKFTWSIDRANWKLFNQLTEIREEVTMFQSVDECIEHFHRKIMAASEKSIPKRNTTSRKSNVPWWNDSCSKAIKEKVKTFRKYIRTGRIEHKIEMNRTRAVARRTVKRAKRDSWRKYTSGITSSTPSKVIWDKVKKIAKKSNTFQHPVLRDGNEEIFDPKEVANKLATSFAHTSKVQEVNRRHYERGYMDRMTKSFEVQNNKDYNKDFTWKEFQEALQTRGATSPGPDLVHYEMLKHLNISAANFLLGTFNKIWSSGTFPDMWRKAEVVPIPKEGKDPTSATNFRPISLTSCVCKLMEKMVSSRLTYMLEKEENIPQTQSGFRKFRSTYDPLILLDKKINEALDHKEIALAIFFDLQKAYDTTPRWKVLDCLKDFGFVGALPLFIKNLLSSRTFQVRVGTSTSDPFEQEEGVPQGGILSVHCFSMVMNTVVESLPPGTWNSIYADDLALCISGRSMRTVERRAQLAINHVNQWAESLGLKISESKTVCLPFHKYQRPPPPDPQLKLNGSQVPVVETHRFLGLVFNRTHSWEPHIRELKKACQKPLQLMDYLSHTTWGADRGSLLRIYDALVQSKLDYGCAIYGAASERLLKKLDPVQTKGLRLATGAFKSSPKVSLQAECDVMPLKHRRDFLKMKLYLRSHRVVDSLVCEAFEVSLDPESAWPLASKLATMSEQHPMDASLVSPIEPQEVPPWMLSPLTFCKGMCDVEKGQLTSQAARALFCEHSREHHLNTVWAFTDGTRSETGTASAAVLWTSPKISRKLHLHSDASIFSAEVYAIIEALQLIQYRKERAFTIFSDSRSTLMSLERYDPPHPLVRKVQELFHAVRTTGKVIDLCWIPSHMGIEGNEEADGAAKTALILPIERKQLPYRDYVRSAKKYHRELWQDEWDQLGPVKLRIIKPRLRYWTSSFHKSRHKEVILARLRIGHTRLTHCHLMKKEPAPVCQRCRVTVSVLHVLIECPLYHDQRRKLLPNAADLTNEEGLRQILAEETNFNIEKILVFLKETKVLDHI